MSADYVKEGENYMINLKDVMFIKCEEFDSCHPRANKYGMRTFWRADYHGETIVSLCDTKADCLEKVKEYIRCENRKKDKTPYER